MNVILLIVAICLGLLYVQAELNHRTTQRRFDGVFHRINSMEPFVIQTTTVVNEIQRDLMAEPPLSETFGSVTLAEVLELMPKERDLVAFEQHTEDALNIVRGAN